MQNIRVPLYSEQRELQKMSHCLDNKSQQTGTERSVRKAENSDMDCMQKWTSCNDWQYPKLSQQVPKMKSTITYYTCKTWQQKPQTKGHKICLGLQNKIHFQMVAFGRTCPTTRKFAQMSVSSFIFHIGEPQPLLRGSICRTVTNTFNNLIHYRLWKGTNEAQVSHCNWAY